MYVQIGLLYPLVSGKSFGGRAPWSSLKKIKIDILKF
jgi:hypothetical protein